MQRLIFQSFSSMYCVDKICKFLIVGLFLYFVGGFMFRMVFGGQSTSMPVVENFATI